MDRLGDYRLRKRLAVGGMGEVYLGEKIGPEGFVKPVVLKCVLPQLAKDPSFVQLFLDEARLAALLNHPNVAQVYDFGVVDGVYFIAMEYVPGYTFDDIRRKLSSIGAFMPLRHIASVASQACQGLHYAHALTDGRGESLGLVHRDVSPHNLIVSIDGTVKLVDFGIAKARAGLTRVRAKGAVGKLGYMSPEQSRGESVDGRSDVFSLGICLWELTTNERLWPADLERAPDYRLDQPIRSVDAVRPEVPRQFSHILQTALAIDRDQRFATAQDMHVALERFQAAMTHYAGQAALAEFLRDLVEGRVRDAAPLVPTSGRSSPVSPFANLTDGLSVPDVEAEGRGEGAAAGRRLPASWEAPSADLPAARFGGTKEVEFAGDPSAVPELAGTPTRARPTPTAPAPRARGRRSYQGAVAVAVVLVAAVGLGALVWWQRAAITDLPSRLGDILFRAPTGMATALGSECRIETTPPGARVWVDGRELSDRTPLRVELIPDVEHMVEIRMQGRATVVRRVVGRVSDEPQAVEVDLEPAATLEVISEPGGATVQVEGRRIPGRTPVVIDDVPAGRSIRVRVERAGVQPAVRDVEVEPGKSAQVRFDLGRGSSTE